MKNQNWRRRPDISMDLTIKTTYTPSELAKKNRITILLGYLFDRHSSFTKLPKELIEIILTTGFLYFEVIKNMTKFGASSGENFLFAPNILHSENGCMSTSICNEHQGEEIIAWEVFCFLPIFYLV